MCVCEATTPNRILINSLILPSIPNQNPAKIPMKIPPQPPIPRSKNVNKPTTQPLVGPEPPQLTPRRLLEVNLSPACESRTTWMSEMLERASAFPQQFAGGSFLDGTSQSKMHDELGQAGRPMTSETSICVFFFLLYWFYNGCSVDVRWMLCGFIRIYLEVTSIACISMEN